MRYLLLNLRKVLLDQFGMLLLEVAVELCHAVSLLDIAARRVWRHTGDVVNLDAVTKTSLLIKTTNMRKRVQVDRNDAHILRPAGT